MIGTCQATPLNLPGDGCTSWFYFHDSLLNKYFSSSTALPCCPQRTRHAVSLQEFLSVIPAPHLSFPLPICHSRENGNLSSSLRNITTGKFILYFLLKKQDSPNVLSNYKIRLYMRYCYIKN